MKNLVIALLLLYAGTALAQEFNRIHLPEAKVNVENFQKENEFIIPVKPQENGEFEKDPAGYALKNFDFEGIMEQIDSDKFSAFDFAFKSRKGTLHMIFNKKRELISTSSNFNNIILPHSLKRKLLEDHKEWNMIKNTYTYKNVNGVTKENQYRIVIEKGKKRKTIKLKGEDIRDQIASMGKN